MARLPQAPSGVEPLSTCSNCCAGAQSPVRGAAPADALGACRTRRGRGRVFLEETWGRPSGAGIRRPLCTGELPHQRGPRTTPVSATAWYGVCTGPMAQPTCSCVPGSQPSTYTFWRGWVGGWVGDVWLQPALVTSPSFSTFIKTPGTTPHPLNIPARSPPLSLSSWYFYLRSRGTRAVKFLLWSGPRSRPLLHFLLSPLPPPHPTGLPGAPGSTDYYWMAHLRPASW